MADPVIEPGPNPFEVESDQSDKGHDRGDRQMRISHEAVPKGPRWELWSLDHTLRFSAKPRHKWRVSTILHRLRLTRRAGFFRASS